MLSIGLFARTGGVTIQALRHYDKLGLLSPESVDAFTGYRHYSTAQLPRLHRILALKALGLSLEQIGGVLRDGVSAEQLRGMLTLRRAQLRAELEASQLQLAMVDAHITQIEQEGHMDRTTVVIKTTPKQWIAAKRVRITDNSPVVLQGLNEAYATLQAWMAKQRHPITGPAIAVWENAPAGEEGWCVDAAFPTLSEVRGADGFDTRMLPEETVASLIFQGNFNNFKDSYPTLIGWIERNGYRMSGAARELYHHFDPAALDAVTVEVQMPVAPLSR